jgi:hypothetical protein
MTRSGFGTAIDCRALAAGACSESDRSSVHCVASTLQEPCRATRATFAGGGPRSAVDQETCERQTPRSRNG